MGAAGPREGLVGLSKELPEIFPGLQVTSWAVTSPRTPEYNCIAWAAGDETRFWWPDAGRNYYWPASVPREESVEAFIAAFGALGYEPCEADEGTPASQWERVAIYVKEGKPEHAARQLPTGEWTSKCGNLEDIVHTLDGLEGSWYGAAAVMMRRRRARPGLPERGVQT